ncbi:MAG: phosphotransferase [Proteobacteria bacterium]|nr:phosphotransferase [Pseudomonadota bacterium]MCG6934775.1 phosphotransferase [Pseudomonadota bacterium]
MDKRFERLQLWLPEVAGIADCDITPASADASFRRYFRIRFDGQSRIVMDAPPAQEDCHPFVQISALLSDIGLHVPEVLVEDLEQGFLLLTDLGERMYLDELNGRSVGALYGDAMQALLRLQAYGPAPLPAYDQDLLWREMELFREWYLGRHLGLALTPDQQAIIDQVFHFLSESALQQPRVIVHRDYHSRNLMVSDPNPGILDFQDAVMGPVSYDLVSLLRDCYIAWPQQQVQHWLQDYHRQLLDRQIIDGVSLAEFQRWFDLMGIQRHLKASGIFARLNYRDGKPGYLADIPRTLAYVLDVGQGYPELQDFIRLLGEYEVMFASRSL